MGALADGELPDLLRSMDDASGQRLIGHLQETGGNAAVQRISDYEMIGKAGGFEKPSGPFKPLDTTPRPPPGPEKQKSTLEEIREITQNTWVGPLDELKLGRLWSSFGSALPKTVDANPGLWEASRDRGMDLRDIGTINLALTGLGSEVRAIAMEYLEKNYTDAIKSQKELGLDFGSRSKVLGMETGKGPTEAQVERRKELEWAAIQLQELRKVKSRLETQEIGFVEIPRSSASTIKMTGEDYGGIYPVRFTPGRPPPISWDDPRGRQAVVPHNVVSYEEVMAQWKPITAALLTMADEHPVLFTALREDKLGQVAGETLSDDPAGAMRTLLINLVASIRETKENVRSGSIDWQELKPIHRQLLEGERKGKVPWNHPVYKEAAKDRIGDYETGQTMADIGIGIAAAVMFIFASAATGGTAAAFLLAGMGIGAGNAYSKWDSYDELKDAAKSATSSSTELVGQEQVDAAFIDAILESAFVALDAWQAGKAGLKLAAGAAAKRAGARAGATEGVESLAKQIAKGSVSEASARELVEKSVVEQGVEATAARMGLKDADGVVQPSLLAAHVAKDSPAAARIAQYVSTVAAMGKDVDVAKVIRNLVEESGKRGPTELDGIVRVAIERYGPLKTIQMAGGWKNLAFTLGGESGAGRLILQWRDAIYRDLKSYVRTQLGAATDEEMEAFLKETGTLGDVTNDLDMSFLGKDAAANRSKALQFLAGRAGLPPNVGILDSMLYIGLFTDPRRLHLFDRFPDLAADLSKKTADFEQELIWNAELHRVKGNPRRAARVRDGMRELEIPEMANFEPLHKHAVTVLSEHQDRLVAEIEQLAAKEPPDKATLSRKVLELAQTQAQINVKEGGGYFSGGGVRRFVTEDAKNPFPGYGPGEAPARTVEIDPQAALDQVGKLRAANDKLAGAIAKGPAGLADVAGNIKSIAKYGSRFADAAKTVGAKIPDPATFGEMAKEFERILALARSKTTKTLQTELRGNFDDLMRRLSGAVSQFDEVHIAVLSELRKQAGTLGREQVAPDIVKATMNRYRWMVFRANLLHEAAFLGRLIDEDVDAGAEEVAPEGAASAGAATPTAAAAP